MSKVISTIERFLLRAIIRHRMRAYPYGSPHPETVKAITSGLCAVIDLSNARPAKYADEPWLKQEAWDHAFHCEKHASNARLSSWPLMPRGTWKSDLDQPEIAHACLRAMFCLYQHGKEKGNGKA